MPMIHRDGARLYWRSDGKPGLPVLLLGNSLGTDQSLWDPAMPELMQSFNVLRMDMRGHGASELATGAATTDWTIETFARDVLAVADAAGALGFYFAGISIGGMIGLWLGAHASNRVLGLLVSNTAARLPEGVWESRIAAVRQGGMEALVDNTMQRWFTPAFAARDDATLATIRQNFLRVSPFAYAGFCAVLRDMDLSSILNLVSVRTRVLTGRHDSSTPPVLGQTIAASVTNAVCIELPVAHIPVAELPARFSAEIRQLLEYHP